MEIEKVAAESPRKSRSISAVIGLAPFRRRAWRTPSTSRPAVRKAAALMQGLYAAFIGKRTARRSRSTRSSSPGRTTM